MEESAKKQSTEKTWLGASAREREVLKNCLT